jgi:hypothetical protein
MNRECARNDGRRHASIIVLIATVLGSGCAGAPEVAETAQAATAAPVALGDPLPGLTSAELARFASGADVFTEVETVADGSAPCSTNGRAATATTSARPAAPACSSRCGPDLSTAAERSTRSPCKAGSSSISSA